MAVARLGCCPKRLVADVTRNVLEDGARPLELIEVELCERFGWTLTELDEQDATRVLPGVYAGNIHGALKRVVRYTETQGRAAPSENDWKIYQFARETRAEYDDGAGK